MSSVTSDTLVEGRFQLREVIGEGGMARVYSAYDKRLLRHLAIKILNPEFARRDAIRQRFLQEARTMATLDDPRVVRIIDYGEEDDRVYIIMELVDGGSLLDRVRDHGPLPPRMAASATLEICRALEKAHQAGIRHRDVKPHNVLLTRSGNIRITDFGIAQVEREEGHGLTRTGAVMGTWGYMAPEQKTDASTVDERADIYATGATLWAMLRAETPPELFMADTEASMLDGMPDVLAEVIRRATRYRRDERYPNMRAMADSLGALLALLPDDPTNAVPLVPPKTPGGRSSAVDTMIQLGVSVPPPATTRDRTGWPTGNSSQTIGPDDVAGPVSQGRGSTPARPHEPTLIPNDGGSGTIVAPDAPPPAPAVKASELPTRPLPPPTSPGIDRSDRIDTLSEPARTGGGFRLLAVVAVVLAVFGALVVGLWIGFGSGLEVKGVGADASAVPGEPTPGEPTPAGADPTTPPVDPAATTAATPPPGTNPAATEPVSPTPPVATASPTAPPPSTTPATTSPTTASPTTASPTTASPTTASTAPTTSSPPSHLGTSPLPPATTPAVDPAATTAATNPEATSATKGTLEHIPPGPARVGDTLTFRASIGEGWQVKLYYRAKGATTFQDKLLVPRTDGYAASLHVDDAMVAGVEYFLEATRGSAKAFQGRYSAPIFIAVQQ
jgi:serine/threonine protein kinase